ncbi:Pentalenene oxygenase [Arenibacter antarcticus]|uniref:Cytochrome P450 n=1 Tax=Arenibacter antarcticus TaxID=2040469 RepID=A0ABW5VC81_9FLAO|nr:cytochrome P450 [Arenibacter sp. H213]MCM4169300.1 cytochrome P450 [Arenibacter sp. H213]
MNNLKLVSRFHVLKNARGILKNPLPFHHMNFEAYGDHFKIRLSGKESVLFTRNPGLIKHILQKQHKKFQKSPLQTVDLAKYVGHGILTSNGEHWRTHRRMVQPAFHKKKLENLIEVMRNAILFELGHIVTGREQNVFSLMGDLAFQVVAKSLFSSADIRDKMSRLKYITEANQRMLIKEMRQPYLKGWFKMSGQIDKHLALAAESKTLLREIIEERRGASREMDDLLDMLLKARYEDGSPMSDAQLVDEVLILFTAGHETTANALSFALFLLAKHPEIQEEVHQEVSTVKLKFSEIGFTQWGNIFPLVKQCLEEALRMYPPAYVIDRIALEDDTYEGIAIPKDTMVLMSIYELHRYAEYWEKPDQFMPGRFRTLDKMEYGDFYYPFGAGPRMCVGNNFAMVEMIIAITEIIRKYKITTTMDAIELNPLISLKPKGVTLMFKER